MEMLGYPVMAHIALVTAHDSVDMVRIVHLDLTVLSYLYDGTKSRIIKSWVSDNLQR